MSAYRDWLPTAFGQNRKLRADAQYALESGRAGRRSTKNIVSRIMTETTSTPDASPTDDLGFSYAAHRDGRVDLFHHGRLAVRLRGHIARDFIAEVEACGNPEGQQLMARLTGNYKRGNERTAKDHPRNRR